MSDAIKHECGIAMVRLLKPLEYYRKKYGDVFWGMNKLYLLMEKQHNRGQEGAGNGFGKVECPSGRRIYLPGEGGRNGGYSGYFFCCPPGDYRMPEDRTGGARRGVAFYRRDVHGAFALQYNGAFGDFIPASFFAS